MQDLTRPIPTVIYEYAVAPNGDQRFNYLSDGVMDLLGVTSEALRENPELLYTNIHVEDRAALKQALGMKASPGESRTVRVRLHTKDQLIQVQFIFSDDVTGEGTILRRGVLQATTSVEDSGHYEALLEKLPIGVVIHHEGEVMFANPHAHVIIGAKEHGQLIGLNVLNFVHPDFVPHIAQRIKKVSEGDAVPMVEEKFICMDGTIIDVETMAFPLFYRGKAAVQVIFRDITDRKRTESRIRRNETLFTQLFQNVPMAIVMLDETGKVSEINRGFEQMFGYSKEELRGKNLNDFIVPEELRNEGIDLNNLISSNQVVSMESI
ncbi:MAG TPA: PAS domain S-box protein, partial [Chryseosolibacter sp.]|nr:PAS domain S-box protein [Chryseosolibacter sp.]